jgi:tetratricopeptide (TPR) repeat protein
VRLEPRDDRRRFVAKGLPARRGLNLFQVTFGQRTGPVIEVALDRITIRPSHPGYALIGTAPPPARLAPEHERLAVRQEQAAVRADWDQVILLGEALNAAAPAYGPAWLLRGDAYRRRGGKRRVAIDALDEAVRLMPHDTSAWRALGRAFRNDSWLPESRRCLVYALALDPTSVEGWLELAQTERRMGRTRDAEQHAKLAR